ncbi:hypothetical protein [Enterococcus malodoratus]|uniref:hypothetical protein n=1 Tax=Enterococcus malodoratus TaxID=71451 RepID=UPI0039B0FA30
MNKGLVFILGVTLIIIVLSVVLFWKFNIKDANKKEKTASNVIKEFLPLLVAYVAILPAALPYILPDDRTAVYFPGYEDKIEEVNKLKKENTELKNTIADQTQEQGKLSEKNKDLSKKNFAELSKVSLVSDGLPIKNGNNAIANVNGSTYYNEDIVKNLVGKDANFDEDSKTVYIGSESDQKVTKQSLSDQYSMLYGGENYESLKDPEEDYHVGGESIKDGFVFKGYSFTDNVALLNTNKKFTKVAFDIGKVDESKSSLEDGKLKVSLNGENKNQETVRADVTSQHFEYDITDVKTLKLELTDSGSSFGVYNMVFTK